jgi:hypothetical protein
MKRTEMSLSTGIALDELECSTSRPGRFTPGKEHQYQLNRMLGGSESRDEGFQEEENLLALPDFEPQTIQPAALLRILSNE